MGRPWLRAGLLALMTTLVPLGSAFAHCVVGNRFFPATLNVDHLRRGHVSGRCGGDRSDQSR